jgi:cytidylate kinase
MEKGFVVAIDGPAGAGKSTVAKLAAAALHFAYIDTGAMYRAVTLKMLQTGTEFSPEAVGKLAQECKICFKPDGKINRVFLDSKEVTELIRTDAVNKNVSRVSAVKEVREAMVAEQRRLGQAGNVVLDGRDIGTVVFPHADCKIFLTASVKERARRRYEELKAKGTAVVLEDVEKDIARRDKLDSERAIAPLKQAADATLLDTSNMDIEQVVAAILKLVRGVQ